ncbi:protein STRICTOSIDINE SYNTHASE-LIKE 7-like [Eucalyptus grandis]|uniref:protein STRICTOSIDINE SYNTHASE-LIKE 7-like n=1 Tax=Eucalyptus grandis TaxID=71139 RepID=UPI00192EDDE8|nr:protein STRICTOSIDINE SYNTHASE-LIKE 7-like [Eucalyptus grandis]
MSESRASFPLRPPPTKTSLKPSLAVTIPSVLAPVLAITILYRLEPFDPAPLPPHGLSGTVTAPKENSRMLRGAEMVRAGRVVGPEDVVYDTESGVIYVGCADGWVKRIKVSGSGRDFAVEDWVNISRRLLGLALGRDDELLVCGSYKGLLKVSKRDGTVELLTDEAEGLKFNLTDGANVVREGRYTSPTPHTRTP